jgi:AbrB family looped-hinge helix DNA binding protein
LYVSILVGIEKIKMGKDPVELASGEEITLKVDDRGRVTLPKEIRDQLGIESNDEIPARLVGSVLEVNPNPSSKLQTATAGRDSWENTTPTDAGKSLFGPIDGHE